MGLFNARGAQLLVLSLSGANAGTITLPPRAIVSPTSAPTSKQHGPIHGPIAARSSLGAPPLAQPRRLLRRGDDPVQPGFGRQRR